MGPGRVSIGSYYDFTSDMLHRRACWSARRRFRVLSLAVLKVFLAMMSTQQMQHLLFPNQLQALIQQKQQALMLQQVRI